MACKVCEEKAQREDNCGYQFNAYNIRSSCRHVDAEAVQEGDVYKSFFSAIASLVDGGSFDLTDSPKSMVGNVTRLVDECRNALDLSKINAAPQEITETAMSGTADAVRTSPAGAAPYTDLVERLRYIASTDDAKFSDIAPTLDEAAAAIAKLAKGEK